MMLPEILAHRYQMPCRPTRRITSDVTRPGSNQFHHHFDDMAGSAKLAVLPGSGDLAEHIPIEVAFGVAGQAVVHLLRGSQQLADCTIALLRGRGKVKDAMNF